MAYSIRPEYGIASYLIPFIIPIIAGIVLFLFPNTISTKLTNNLAETPEIKSPQSVIQVFCIALGLVFLFFSASDIAYYAATAIVLAASKDQELTLLTFDYPGLVATLIEVLFALFLIFKSKYLVKIIPC